MANVEIAAVSGDPAEKARELVRRNGSSVPVAFGLTGDQMRRLGLYISLLCLPEETDRPLAEPATFVKIQTAGYTSSRSRTRPSTAPI